MKAFSGLLWVGTLFGVVVGTFFFINSILSAQSAPQQGALAAMGAAAAILPYIAARAFDALRSPDPWEKKKAQVGQNNIPHVPLAAPRPKEVSAQQFASARKRATIVWSFAGLVAVGAMAMGILSGQLATGSPSGISAEGAGNAGFVLGFVFFITALYGAFVSRNVARMVVQPPPPGLAKK